MIIQGTNKPITVTFTETPISASLALVNEIEVLKRWALVDLVDSGDGLTFKAPVSQEESFGWEEGPCWLELEWLTEEHGEKQHARMRDDIIYRMDKTVLAEEVE